MVAITQFLVAGLMTVAVQALPQPQAAQPTASSAAAPAATKKAISAAELASLAAIPRFQKLLTEGGEGKTLLTGDDLKKQIVFPFSPPARTDASPKGGVAVSANIGSFPILTGLGISTTLGFVEPCGINTPYVAQPVPCKYTTNISQSRPPPSHRVPDPS
jgi:hypothetical protein